jgi:hypothetical protein
MNNKSRSLHDLIALTRSQIILMNKINLNRHGVKFFSSELYMQRKIHSDRLHL